MESTHRAFDESAATLSHAEESLKVLKEDRRALDEVAATFSHSVKRRLIMWCVRWTIGFGIIALVVRFWPALSWLWWVGAGVAVLSLALTVTMSWVVHRRVGMVRRAVIDVERLAAQTVQENAHAGDGA